MQQHSTAQAPPHQFPPFVRPGMLRLESIRWGYGKAVVTGDVGGSEFRAIVETDVLLDRRSFTRHLWRFHRVFAILPDIESWRESIARAEVAAQ